MDIDLNSIIASLKKIKAQKIVLFGSYAYGQPTQNSDIDLLVIADTDKSFHERIQQARPLLTRSKPIDLIILTPTEYQRSRLVNPLILEIESKGRVIYG